MLVCSIHDPAIFDAKLLREDVHYEGRLDQHLENVRLTHLLVCDDSPGNSLIWKDILAAATASPYLSAKLNACVNLQRIIYLPCEKIRYEKILKWLDRPGSASAVGLICHGKIDVLIAAQDTREAMAVEGLDIGKTSTMVDYHRSPVAARERLLFAGRPVGALSRDEFLREIIIPVVCWARHVTVIDKMLTLAAFGGNEATGRPNANWSKFRATLQCIYEAWMKTPCSRDGKFEVISSHNHFKVGDDLAKELAEKLDLAKPNVKVSLKSDSEVGAINHDRYLVTDKDVCVGFTKGFDLLGPDAPCGVSDVYIRQPQLEKDTVAQLMHAPAVGTWCGTKVSGSAR